MAENTNPYDAVPYESQPFADTHVDRLAAMATLFGLNPPNIERCRVLELGCSHGVNLIPMALDLPGAKFLGIDLSRKQVEDAQKLAAKLGVKNIELKATSILDINEKTGKFDYIICHGVYSWVPPLVQKKILEICSKQLTPNGLAYISYNTYPGWFVHRMVREMMLYHSRQFTDPIERSQQARNFLEFVAQAAVAEPGSTYTPSLQGAVQAMRQKTDAYFIHEYLEDVNEPMYFYEFVDQITANGLKYVTDARLSTTATGMLAAGVVDALKQWARDPVREEQYLDFVVKRFFRRSIVCRADLKPSLTAQPDRLKLLQFTTLLRPTLPTVDLRSRNGEEFRSPDGRTVTVVDPLVKAALQYLGEIWPRSATWNDLWKAVSGRIDAAIVNLDSDALLNNLLFTHQNSALVGFHVAPPPCRSEVSAKPVASPLARHQAALAARVTNVRHEIVELNDFNRFLVTNMDGTRDFAALTQAMSNLVAKGTVQYWHENQQVTDPRVIREVIQKNLERHLTWLMRCCLLVG